jgi:hypothetical protein
MRVTCYPADVFACGHFRLTWPARALQAQGLDVEVIEPSGRDIKLIVGADNIVSDVLMTTDDTDVVVFQRLTHPWLCQAVSILRGKGVAVVVDVDDDLSSIHPRNPAYEQLHPRHTRVPQQRGRQQRHSWTYLAQACRDATLVTATTPALLKVYAQHGRGRVIPNFLPDHYYGLPRTDSEVIGWPATLVSHPDDPSVLGGAVARLVNEGAQFRIVGGPAGCGEAFGLLKDPPGGDIIDMAEWPAAVARLGIGIAPLADTKFNAGKSALKPMEMAVTGVPCVMSPREDYVRLHALGVGLLADRPRTWYSKINLLRTNERARLELSDQGRAATDGLRISDHAWRWAEVWAEALAIQRGGSSAAGRGTGGRSLPAARTTP